MPQRSLSPDDGRGTYAGPKTVDGFRATVRALRSLYGSKGVSFHTFSLPEDRCVRLLLKNFGKHMPESVVREELETLGIHVQGVLQLRSGRHDQDVAPALTLTPHFIVSVARGAEAQKVRTLTELCGLRVSVELYVAPKSPLQCKRCQLFGHTQRNCGYSPRCVACGEALLSGECSNPKQQLKCCSCGGNYKANYRGCLKWKEAKAALVKRGQPERRQAICAPGRPAAPQPARAVPTAELESLGPGWNHVVKGGRVLKSTFPNPAESSPKLVTAAPEQSKVSICKKGGAAAIPALKSTKALRQAHVKNTQEEVKAGKSSPKILKPLPVGLHLKLPSRQSRRSPIYSTPFPSRLCEAEASAPHSGTHPPFRGGPLVGRP
jgi:hypothetical protein